MAVTYTWFINEVKVFPTGSDTQVPINTCNDVIHEITYTLEGTDNRNDIQYRDSHTDMLCMSTSNLSSFTSFDDLNQETVIEWVKTELTGLTSTENQNLVESLKSKISASIEYNMNPTSVVKYLQ